MCGNEITSPTLPVSLGVPPIKICHINKSSHVIIMRFLAFTFHFIPIFVFNQLLLPPRLPPPSNFCIYQIALLVLSIKIMQTFTLLAMEKIKNILMEMVDKLVKIMTKNKVNG